MRSARARAFASRRPCHDSYVSGCLNDEDDDDHNGSSGDDGIDDDGADSLILV